MKVTKIEVSNDEKDFFFDIEVDEVHEYLLENGVVVHNSANASGTTNAVYPIRELTMIKTDNHRVNYWAAPEGEELAQWYESAWDIPAKDMTDAYAILQKWTDQAISADFYRKVIGSTFIETSEMIRDYLYRVRMGLKTKYYMNQKTSAGFSQRDEPTHDTDFDSGDVECGGACTL